MTTAIYEETKKEIDEAYRNKNKPKIEKETNFILNQLIISIMSLFNDRVKGVTIDNLTHDNPYIFSSNNRDSLDIWLDRLLNMEPFSNDIEFGKLKTDIEIWYHQLGGQEMHFEYQQDHLLTPSQAAKKLGISNVTLNKYIKQGLECVNTTSHHKIPKHAVALWKDPIYALKVQMLAQEKKLQKQTPEERISEIESELLTFQKKYKTKTYQKAFAAVNIDALDDPSDYYEWRDLEEEKDNLLTNLLSGGWHEEN